MRRRQSLMLRHAEKHSLEAMEERRLRGKEAQAERFGQEMQAQAKEEVGRQDRKPARLVRPIAGGERGDHPGQSGAVPGLAGWLTGWQAVAPHVAWLSVMWLWLLQVEVWSAQSNQREAARERTSPTRKLVAGRQRAFLQGYGVVAPTASSSSRGGNDDTSSLGSTSSTTARTTANASSSQPLLLRLSSRPRTAGSLADAQEHYLLGPQLHLVRPHTYTEPASQRPSLPPSTCVPSPPPAAAASLLFTLAVLWCVVLQVQRPDPRWPSSSLTRRPLTSSSLLSLRSPASSTARSGGGPPLRSNPSSPLGQVPPEAVIRRRSLADTRLTQPSPRILSVDCSQPQQALPQQQPGLSPAVPM